MSLSCMIPLLDHPPVVWLLQHTQVHMYESTFTASYHILLVNSRGYYKFQVEIGVATNRDFNIKIVHKT